MELYGTIPSPFTRKVRICAQYHGIELEFKTLNQLLETGPEKFAQNPLHMFPVLKDGDAWIIESDIICEYLVDTLGKESPFLAPIKQPQHRYFHLVFNAIANGAMEAGVHIIRAQRSGITTKGDIPFFNQERAAIAESLAWLERQVTNLDPTVSQSINLLTASLISFLEWGLFRELIPDLSDFRSLDNFVKSFADQELIQSTKPDL